ncbi:MAG: RimK/LysX family protein [Aquisalimonadaceae bacterium]
MAHVREQLTVGWREWASLPALGIDAVKIKVDTGALTSALHAIHVRRFRDNGRTRVRFEVHPLQRRSDVTCSCVADLVGERLVTSSSGHREKRPVIRTMLDLGGHRWSIDLTLTNRDSMGFRMLLGRRAMRRHILVDPSESFIVSQEPDGIDLAAADLA